MKPSRAAELPLRIGRRVARIGACVAMSLQAAVVFPPAVHTAMVRVAQHVTSPSSVRTIPVGMYPQALAVDSRTRRAFVRRYDGRILVIDTASLHVVGTTPLPQTFYMTHALAVDERRGRVFVLNRRDATHPGAAGTVTVLDATSGARLQTITVGIGPVDVAIADRTGRVFVANAGDPPRYGASVSVLDARTGALLRTIPMAAYPALAVDDQRRRVFAPTLAGLVVLDAASGARLRTIANTGPSCCDTTPVVDERSGHVIVAPASGNQVRLVDPAAGRVMRTITVGGALTQDYLGGFQIAMAVAQWIGHVFVAWKGGYDTGQVTMLAGATGRVLHTLTVKPGPRAEPPIGLRDEPTAVAVDERIGRVFVACLDNDNVHGLGVGAGALRVLDATSGALLTTIPVGMGPAAVAVDDSTQRVFVLNNEGTVSVFDARVGGTTSPK